MIKVKSKPGFTLIEMMVSVAIFVMVAMIVSTIFVTMAQAYRRAQAMKTVIDNVHFAVDTMVLDLKNGRGYEVCGGPQEGGHCIEFTNLDGNKVEYKLKNGNLVVENDEEGILTDQASITIKRLNFNVQGEESFHQKVQIVLQGEAESFLGDSTEFSLQTVVSKRYVQE
ncbi:MAG: prepilin-type N-terminal cleavage/methylation domain-containing protein [Candidatus Paceibacterota bacterium]